MRSKNIKFDADNSDFEQITKRNDLLDKWMMVKEDKPNSCYTYVDFLSNLKTMSA